MDRTEAHKKRVSDDLDFLDPYLLFIEAVQISRPEEAKKLREVSESPALVPVTSEAVEYLADIVLSSQIRLSFQSSLNAIFFAPLNLR